MIVLQYFSLSQCVRMQHVRSVFMYVFADNCECIQQKNYISRDSRDSREIVHPGMEFPGSTRAGHTRTLSVGHGPPSPHTSLLKKLITEI